MVIKVDYLSHRIVRTGGTKIIAQHVKLLQERGHDVRILTTDDRGEELWGIPVTRVKSYNQNILGQSDIIIGSWVRDIEAASKVEGPIICHLCQAYEPLDLSIRIREEVIPLRYRYGSRVNRFLFMRKKWSLQRRIRKIEKVYRLPTVKIAVSQALKELLDRIYDGPCFFVPNGIDQNIFSPSILSKNYQVPLQILSIGTLDRVTTGIDDTYTAIRLLKQKGIQLKFIRVSLYPFNEAEMKYGLVDRFIMGVNEKEMVELYRNSHILIAPSLWEGFGLPVMEAMSCGLPCLLADSGSYGSLDPVKDFAFFVPTHSPERIVEGVIKIKDDIAFRERIIKRGLEVSRQYSLENMDNALEKTLFDILKK